MTPAMWLLVISVFLLGYVYGIYPALCWLRARLRPRPWQSNADFRPSVSVLIAAYNEAAEIRKRILNIADQQTDFPVEILVGSDGSDDGTVVVAAETAEEIHQRNIALRIFDFPRGGKIATLSRLIEESRSEVLVFTDANSSFAPDALRAIVEPLGDPTVGCAGGVKRICSGSVETGEGEKSYWDFENRLKQWESIAASCAGADGALYAVRRRDLPELVTNRLLADDFYISLSVCMRGLRCVQAPEAIALEASDTTASNELKRKARILAGALAALALTWRLCLPRSGMSLTLWSHKLLRWFSFVPAVGVLVGAIGLGDPAREYFYVCVACAALLAMAGALFPASLRLKPFKYFYYFALMNFGQMLGLVEWLSGGNEAAWEKLR